jgi:hypothetical protein
MTADERHCERGRQEVEERSGYNHHRESMCAKRGSGLNADDDMVTLLPRGVRLGAAIENGM